MMDHPLQDDYGRRDSRAERFRLAGGVLLILIVILLEATLGRDQERRQAESFPAGDPAGWALQRYLDPTESVPIPPKKPGGRRFLYLSNSHAKTGGEVARHLQQLLDRLSPGVYEVLDMSEAGIFAPDMLERMAAGLDYELDGVILAPAYISFSDRMKLSRQRASARSFFKPAVFPRLPAGFWLRNYDLSLYGETLVARELRLFRRRNALRDVWEQPLVAGLKKLTGDEVVRFLEVDEFLGWKFPDGFDGNLFDWSLYAIGRDGHLADMRALIDICRRRGLPLLAVNLPVHWEKDPHQVESEDVLVYRRSLEDLFRTAVEYVDYQDWFPKEFTTYDALHPTWYGARLHALDLALRMNAHEWLGPGLTAEQIVDAFLDMDEGVSAAYRERLDRNYPPDEDGTTRRLDFFEPDNAREIMRRLAACPPGSHEEWALIMQLARRIRFWRETAFEYRNDRASPFSNQWRRALETEIQRAKERTAYFERELVRFQTKRLEAGFPLPDLTGLRPAGEKTILNRPGVKIIEQTYNLPEGGQVRALKETQTNRTILYQVLKPKRQYVRLDVLGNGSHILVQPTTMKPWLPSWVFSQPPRIDWGI